MAEVKVLFVAVMGVWLTAHAIRCIQDGEITVGGRRKWRTFTREQNPLDFWGFVAWISIFGLAMILMVLYWCINYLSSISQTSQS